METATLARLQVTNPNPNLLLLSFSLRILASLVIYESGPVTCCLSPHSLSLSRIQDSQGLILAWDLQEEAALVFRERDGGGGADCVLVNPKTLNPEP